MQPHQFDEQAFHRMATTLNRQRFFGPRFQTKYKTLVQIAFETRGNYKRHGEALVNCHEKPRHLVYGLWFQRREDRVTTDLLRRSFVRTNLELLRLEIGSDSLVGQKHERDQCSSRLIRLLDPTPQLGKHLDRIRIQAKRPKSILHADERTALFRI